MAESRFLPVRGVAGCERGFRRCSLGALLLALAGIISAPGVAYAQAGDRAAQLFDAGIADLKLEKYATACAALEESHRLDAKLGALIALGDCLERWGKLHSAALRFEALIAAVSSANASASAYRAPQLEYARSALARLTPQIPELRLIFREPSVPELRVLLDGQTLVASPPEQAVRIDPGHHLIETQAPGREPWRLELELKVAEQRSVELELGPGPELPSPVPAASKAPPALVAPEPRAATVLVDEPSERATNPWRTVGWGLGGLGVMGVGLGTVAGIRVLQECPSFECPSQSERGQRLALLTDVGFGVGLVALVGSVVLLLNTDPPAKHVDAAAWHPLGGFDAHGGWLGVNHSF